MKQDVAKTMNLPPKERAEAIEENKKRIFAAGSEARTALIFLGNYFDEKSDDHFKAFAELPRDAEIGQYQAVHSSLLALLELKTDLERKITNADKLAKAPTEARESEANI